jgi:large conductance mechanosensitive channel
LQTIKLITNFHSFVEEKWEHPTKLLGLHPIYEKCHFTTFNYYQSKACIIMGLISEFKEFAMRGNVVDLAVGVIIGGAFGGIVKSMVDDILMPPIGMLMGKVDFKDLKVVMANAVMEGEKVVSPEVSLNYGTFINTVINFLIVAFCIFMVIKGMNTFKKKKEEAPAAPAEPTKEEQLLTEIRDALVKRG